MKYLQTKYSEIKRLLLQFANCLTYAVGVLGRYSNELKIQNWESPKIMNALPLPNLWIRIWHRMQRNQNERLSVVPS